MGVCKWESSNQETEPCPPKHQKDSRISTNSRVSSHLLVLYNVYLFFYAAYLIIFCANKLKLPNMPSHRINKFASHTFCGTVELLMNAHPHLQPPAFYDRFLID